MNLNVKNTFKSITKIILEIIAYHSYTAAKVISFALCLITIQTQVSAGKASYFEFGTLLYLLTYPILTFIIFILLIIPSAICKFILFVFFKKTREYYDGYRNESGGYYNRDYSNGYNRYENSSNYDNYSYKSDRSNYSHTYSNSNNNSNYNQSGFDERYAYEEFKRQYNQYYRQKNNSSNAGSSSSGSNNNYRSSYTSEYDKALKFYGLKMPFTEQELKERRRKMMKTAHPDAGGSTAEAEKINQYYDVLKKYANQ